MIRVAMKALGIKQHRSESMIEMYKNREQMHLKSIGDW